MKQEVKYEYVEGLAPLKNYGEGFVAIKNNQLTSVSKRDVIEKLHISNKVPFAINYCSNDFIGTKSLIDVNEQSITILPIKLKDSTNNIDIELKESITKSISGNFEEGQNLGCKDYAYNEWKQPIMYANTTPLGECRQVSGTLVSGSEPYKAMNGIEGSSDNAWLCSSVNNMWEFNSKIPFIVESIVLINTEVENRTRNINVLTNDNIVKRNYFCNSDALAQNYLVIDEDKRTESYNIEIQTISSFGNPNVGFAQINFNGKTKYIQQNTTYRVYLIANEDLTKIDVLLSENLNPKLPNGFKYYAYIQDVKTADDKIAFKQSLGTTLYFNTNKDIVITNGNGDSYAISSEIKPYTIPSKITTKKILETLYLTKDGVVYGRPQKFYGVVSSLPSAVNGAVAYLVNDNECNAYEFKNNQWVIFNDVPFAEVEYINGEMLNYLQYPCNSNLFNKSVKNNVWVSNEIDISNLARITVMHDLNIENIQDYKFDCILINKEPELGYMKNDIAMNPIITIDNVNQMLKPYLTNNSIGINFGKLNRIIKVSSKYMGSLLPISDYSWKLVFRIWR